MMTIDRRISARASALVRRRAEIRGFFLQPAESYSINELAQLWQVHPADVRDFFDDELGHIPSEVSPRIAWSIAVEATVNSSMIRPVEIERALGSDFTGVRPERWRTVPLVVHLPVFVRDAVAREACLPSNLAPAIRIERLLVERFRNFAELTTNCARTDEGAEREEG